MRIKEVLRKHGITQEEIANRLGINRVSVNRLLNDKNDMRVSTAEKFAAAIGCRVGELFEEEKDEDFTAFIRYKGRHYNADSLEELENIIENIKNISK